MQAVSEEAMNTNTRSPSLRCRMVLLLRKFMGVLPSPLSLFFLSPHIFLTYRPLLSFPSSVSASQVKIKIRQGNARYHAIDLQIRRGAEQSQEIHPVPTPLL